MNTMSAAAQVQQGFRAQGAGDLDGAERHYREALRLQPDHPDALQLLGSLARRRGDATGAEALLRRSLAVQPGQANVWNNLGNLLHAQGRSDEALDCFARAVRLQPGHADAHYNSARVLHALGRLDDAAASLNRALAAAPQPTVAMLQLHAQIEGDAGLTESALATLDRVLQVAPERAALHHNRAVLLQRLHRHAEALAAHERAAALGADAADAHYNRGNTLQSLGRHDAAVAAYRTALEREPAHALSLYDLARLRWRRGEPDFDAELRAAAAQAGASPLLPGLHGHLLWRAERWPEAAAAYREALRRAPQAPGLLDGLGRCLVRLGETEAGLAAHAQAVALEPGNVELRSNHAASLLVAGRPEAAAAEAEAACQAAPLHQQAQALRLLAARLCGRPDPATADDAWRLVQVIDLPPPPGFASMADFNAALAAELGALHADAAAPIDQTLRGGTQTTGDIFEQGHPLVNALKQRIAEAVQAYIDALPADPAHPVLQRRTSGWRFTDSWSSRLRRQGFHTDHVHPHGWISSAYYVQVPPAVQQGQGTAGWLRFGRPDLPLPGIDPETLVQRRERPQPGRLVLFPSMLWHGTEPFDDVAPRLSIAFDVVPT